MKPAAAVASTPSPSEGAFDIEDEDKGRYDQPTLHVEQGVGVALNAGDTSQVTVFGYGLSNASGAGARAGPVRSSGGTGAPSTPVSTGKIQPTSCMV